MKLEGIQLYPELWIHHRAWRSLRCNFVGGRGAGVWDWGSEIVGFGQLACPFTMARRHSCHRSADNCGLQGRKSWVKTRCGQLGIRLWKDS